MAATEHSIVVNLELTPLGRALVVLAVAINNADKRALPPEVLSAAENVVAVYREHTGTEPKE